MIVGPAERVMARALVAASFDEASPDPAVAWAAFLAFAAAPLVAYTTESVSFECFHVSDLNDVLWLTFQRNLELDGMRFGLGCVLSRPVPPDLWAVTASDWCTELETLADWASRVERCPAFRACSSLNGWRWEGFSA